MQELIRANRVSSFVVKLTLELQPNNCDGHVAKTRKSMDDDVDVERANLRRYCICGGANHATGVQERWTMKKNLLQAAVIFTMLASCTAVYAQMGPDQGGGQWSHGPGQPLTADQRLQRMTRQLNLSDAQQQQIKPILESEAKQMQGLHEDPSLSQQDRMSKMMQIRQGTAEQIKPMLNADQQQKYEQMMSHPGHGHGGQGQGQPQGEAPLPQ
jgi:Spy/CpxP family protein refolding chaperone